MHLVIQENRRGDHWSINLDILNTWHRKVTNPATERLQLARVLKRLEKGRLAAKIEPTGNVAIYGILCIEPTGNVAIYGILCICISFGLQW